MMAIRWLCLSLPLLVPVAGRSGEPVPDWEVIVVDQQEYVPARSVREVYGFERLDRKDGRVRFRKGATRMSWEVGAPSVTVNDVKFTLSLPVREREEGVLVARSDWQHVLDPVLRPWFLRKAQPFDTVIIDPGHGGQDPGARSGRRPEKAYALDLARSLRKELEERGLKVRMTRTEDVFVSLFERVRIANETENAVFISLHFNHGKNGGPGGIETLALAAGENASGDGTVSTARPEVHRRDAETVALAAAVHAASVSRTGAGDRGIRRVRFRVLRGIDHPAILLDGGFLSDAQELVRVDTGDDRRKLAGGIADGIAKYRRALGSGGSELEAGRKAR